MADVVAEDILPLDDATAVLIWVLMILTMIKTSAIVARSTWFTAKHVLRHMAALSQEAREIVQTFWALIATLLYWLSLAEASLGGLEWSGDLAWWLMVLRVFTVALLVNGGLYSVSWLMACVVRYRENCSVKPRGERCALLPK